VEADDPESEASPDKGSRKTLSQKQKGCGHRASGRACARPWVQSPAPQIQKNKHFASPTQTIFRSNQRVNEEKNLYRRISANKYKTIIELANTYFASLNDGTDLGNNHQSPSHERLSGNF
jgi:hypothetical protein